MDDRPMTVLVMCGKMIVKPKIKCTIFPLILMVCLGSGLDLFALWVTNT